MFFFALVAPPALRRVEPAELRAQLFRQLGVSFRTVGWIAIMVLLVTGLLNLHFRRMLSAEVLTTRDFWSSTFGIALKWKLGSVAAMLIVRALHDFVWGPSASRATPGTPEALRLRRRAALLARVNALIGILVVVAAVRLARS